MTASEPAAPTGIERTVGPDELFFSTTDRRGVIRSGNSVFVRTSGFTEAELRGSPHNLVRHPDMPAGVYRLMWDRLLAGEPMAGYVLNLAKDGGHYWVFATITPLGDGFLSVRAAPMTPAFRTARDLYRQVRLVEDRRRAEGAPAPAVAEAGAEALLELLRPLGYRSYGDFMAAVLPAEVAAHPHAGSRPARSWAVGPVAEVLAGARSLEGLLRLQVDRLDAYGELCDALDQVSWQVLRTVRRLEGAVNAAQEVSATVASSAPVLLNVANVMAAPMHTAATTLDRLVPRLGSLHRDVSSLRFRIALATLHDDMVDTFAGEVLDGLAPASALAEIPRLCDAVHEGVTEMAVTARHVNAELEEVAGLIAEGVARLDEFRTFLGQWRILVLRHRAGTQLGELLAPIDAEIAAGAQTIEQLRALGGHCRTAVLPLDTAPMERELSRIRGAAAAA